VHLRSPRLGSRRVLLVTSTAGKTLMTMIEDAWGADGVAAFLKALNAPVRVHRDGPLTTAQIARRFPGTFPGWAAHPNITGVAIAGLAIALLVAVLIVFGYSPAPHLN
jgi:hypothetical protein